MNNQIQPYNNNNYNNGSGHGGGFDLTKLIMTLAIAYMVNPIDIPGPLDDGGVLFLAMFLIGLLGLFKGGAQ